MALHFNLIIRRSCILEIRLRLFTSHTTTTLSHLHTLEDEENALRLPAAPELGVLDGDRLIFVRSNQIKLMDV